MTRSALLGFVAGAVVATLGAWIGGFDFDQRGPDALGVYMAALFCGSVGAAVGVVWHDFPR